MIIKGFIHCYATPKGQVILREQLNRLHASTLWAMTNQLFIGVTGGPLDGLTVPCDPKIHIFYSSINNYEGCTLGRLHSECLQYNCYVYYMHTKGASHEDDYERACQWRIRMEDVIIDQWQDCLAAIQLPTIDSCGPLGTNNNRFVFYAGNFWWSKAAHVRTLVSPKEWGRFYVDTGSAERWAYETWITQNKKSNFLFMSAF